MVIALNLNTPDESKWIVQWKNASGVEEKSFVCGYCGMHTSSVKGMSLSETSVDGRMLNADTESKNYGVFICTHCKFPTFIYKDVQVPGDRFGNDVSGISKELTALYNEARNAFSVQSYTGVVLLCRKLLMNIAVELGAQSGRKFIEYVVYLDTNHFISARSKSWVDRIRTEGNEATHETIIKNKEQASDMIKFCEMLLKTNFEYPN